MSFRDATSTDFRAAAGNPASYICTFVAALSFGTALYFGSWVGYVTAGIYVVLALLFIDRDVDHSIRTRQARARQEETDEAIRHSRELRARLENLNVGLGLRCPADCEMCAEDDTRRAAEVAVFLAERAQRHGHGLPARIDALN